MINVYSVDKTFKNGFIVTGHAEYASHGFDIVCAAVSAITQTALLGLQEYASIEKRVRPGYMLVSIEKNNDASDIIVSTALAGLEQIRMQYPDHIQIWRGSHDKEGTWI